MFNKAFQSLFSIAITTLSLQGLSQQRPILLSEDESQIQIRCRSQPGSYITSAVNGILVYEPSLNRFAFWKGESFFRFERNVMGEGYLHFNPDQINYQRYQNIHLSVEDIRYRPERYLNHSRFDFNDPFGEVKWVVPKELAESHLNDLQTKEFKAHMILSHIEDHDGGTSHMNCMASHISNQEEALAGKNHLAQTYWSLQKGLNSKRAEEFYHWLSQSDRKLKKSSRSQYRRQPRFKYQSSIIEDDSIRCSANSFPSLLHYNCVIKTPDAAREKEEFLKNLFEGSDAPSEITLPRNRWDWHREGKKLYGGFVQCFKLSNDQRTRYSCSIR